MGKYSYELEFEADQRGMEILSDAGLDPIIMFNGFTRVCQRIKKKCFDSAIDHPSLDERLGRLRLYIIKKYLSKTAYRPFLF